MSLDLALVLARPAAFEYVLVHELCHYKVKHHGPKFWHLLHRLMPDFEERRKKLNLYAE